VIERLEASVRRAPLPDWIRDSRVELTEDQYGDEAADVHFVLREGREEMLYDGEELNRVQSLVVDAFFAEGVRRFPYVHFYTAAEAA
jgi:hypothetical protein